METTPLTRVKAYVTFPIIATVVDFSFSIHGGSRSKKLVLDVFSLVDFSLSHFMQDATSYVGILLKLKLCPFFFILSMMV